MSRVVFVGEAPSPTTQRFGGAPLVGETGRRLAMWAGLSAADFHARVTCLNLFERLPEKWYPKDARERAIVMWHEQFVEGDRVVMLGVRVAAAFGLKQRVRKRQVLTWFEWVERDLWSYAVMPHPSGLNHYWNVEEHHRLAEEFLQDLLGVERRRVSQLQLAIDAWNWAMGEDE